MLVAVNTTTVCVHPHPKRLVSFVRLSPHCTISFRTSPGPNLRAIAMAATSQQQEQLVIARPDDWRLHLREGGVLEAVLPHSAKHFGRDIIMPNLKPPVTTTACAVEYREEIMRALPPGSSFMPLMTLYLTDNTSPEEIKLARKSGVVFAVKMYPAGSTTNSQDGVTDIFGKCLPVLEEMIRQEMPLLLKIAMEHITAMNAVNFIESCEEGHVAATVTPQHLLLNRNALFLGGLQPHNFCLPVLKRETHREAIVSAVTNGSRRYFLGTDSAPHDKQNKECSCGCAGIYSAPVALSLYAKVFEEPPKEHFKDCLEKECLESSTTYKHSSGEIVPMFTGSTLEWFPSEQSEE
ncbi:hypothetical protein BS78_03G176900 [Paspalum vaginatum]|nr:hypothetical protein BS78_03G176900 [Paspalum vaginatum]